MSGIDIERDGRGVVTLWLSNPDRQNALSNVMVRELCAAMAALAADEDCRIIVLRGRGGVFCAGRDLHDLSALQKASRGEIDRMYDFMEEMNRLTYFSPKPVVAVVERFAYGIAAMLASWADVSIAEETAQLGYPEVRHGIVPYGAAPTMLNTLPQRAILDLILTGRRITAAEAVRLGLVTRATPAVDLDAALEATVADLLAGDPLALSGIKAFVRECERLSYDEGIRAATARAKAGTGNAATVGGIGNFLASHQKHPQKHR
ncbi:MAG: enoyl-CoA hydratase/isomerase family protein [Rhizobiaceae bacterium]